MSLNASFASERMMRLNSRNLVVFFLLTTLTVRDKFHSRSSCCSLPPRPRPRRRCVDAVEMSISHRSPKLTSISVGVGHHWWRRPYTSLLLTSLWLDQSSFWFSVTLPVLRWRVLTSCTLRVLNHLRCGFDFNFYWNIASKACVFSNAIRWLDHKNLSVKRLSNYESNNRVPWEKLKREWFR